VANDRAAGNELSLMDIVYIKQLEIETVIGVFDWERKIRQKVCIDLEMATDIRKAGKTDNLDNALDYKAISKRLIEFVESSNFLLIEALAEHIATILLEEFHVPWLRLTLGKPGAISAAKDVGVIIERGNLD
jgi:dihydroneopterin aldolase